MDKSLRWDNGEGTTNKNMLFVIFVVSFHKTLFFQEEDYRELVSISHNMEEQYGQFFDSVIPFEEVEFVLKQLMYEISLLEMESQWVPAKWVEET